jgi:hypothetical protein
MKIKKEDLGLYFALGLVGAGMGLLVGAFVASRRQGGPVPILDRADAWSKTLEDEKESDKVARKFSRKEKSVKKAGKIDIPKLKRQSELFKKQQLEEFIVKYEPSAIQIEMVKNDLVTLEELEDMMMKEELAKHKEPYDYTEPYLENDKPELSELSKLPEEEDVIDDRYQILQESPKHKSPKNMRVVYFDGEDGSFHTMTRQKRPVPITSIKEFITEETWEVMLPYMISGFAPLFVNDLQTAKWYRFELIPEDVEEFSEDDDTN